MEKKKQHDQIILNAGAAIRKEEKEHDNQSGSHSVCSARSNGNLRPAATALADAQLDTVWWIAKAFENHIIHHTGDSQDNEGKPLIGLCPFTSLTFTVTLSPNEMDALRKSHSENKNGDLYVQRCE